MRLRARTILRLLQETGLQWQQDNVSRLAAALAYYTIFSITPLLIIAIAIAGAVFGQETAQTEIMKQLQDLVGEQGANAIAIALKNANQPTLGGIASSISVVLLLFGASGVFSELQEALNIVWNVKFMPLNMVKKLLLIAMPNILSKQKLLYLLLEIDLN